jgi:hypothetical protein
VHRLADLPAIVLNYLNQGGTTERLRELTRASSGQLVGTVTEADLTGDGVAEVIVATSMESAVEGYPEGALLLFGCQHGVYQLAHGQGFGSYVYEVQVIRVEDLVALGYPQLVVRPVWAGSACLEGIYVLGWDGQAWQTFLNTELPCPVQLELRDRDGDQRQEILLHSPGCVPRFDVSCPTIVKEYRWQENVYRSVDE